MYTTPNALLSRLACPLGTILLVSDAAERLLALDWEDHQPRMERLLQVQRGLPASQLRPWPAPRRLAQQLERYFAGEIDALTAIEVSACGTPFQRAVWAALRRIPAGSTLSYGALARCIGRPSAVRAVGAANGQNPIGLVVPCHRVIGADASLTGYAGGLTRKRWLLRHEAAHGAGPVLARGALELPGAGPSPA
jgi:methylated-DNA-[protein]-cysteine S-methyltransferase